MAQNGAPMAQGKAGAPLRRLWPLKGTITAHSNGARTHPFLAWRTARFGSIKIWRSAIVRKTMVRKIIILSGYCNNVARNGAGKNKLAFRRRVCAQWRGGGATAQTG